MIVDCHTHAFPDDLAPRAIAALNAEVTEEEHAVLDGTVGDLLRSMDRAGIDKAVVWSVATAPKQVDPIIRWSLGIRSDRIIPLGSVHPDCSDVAADVRKVADSGLPGIKLHPQYQGFAVDERRVWPLYEAADEAGLIVAFHAGRDIAFPPEDDRAAPARILRVHEAFPDMPVVAAHLGGWRMWDEVARSLAGTGVYLDTSYTFHLAADDDAVARVLEAHSVDRILFGTDSPWRSQADDLSLIRAAFPDPEDLERVLHGNAQELFGPNST